LSFNLPKDSFSADGGGYKGRSRDMSKQEFIEEYDLKVLIEIACSCSVITSSLEENQYSMIQDNEFSEAISVLCQEILTE